ASCRSALLPVGVDRPHVLVLAGREVEELLRRDLKRAQLGDVAGDLRGPVHGGEGAWGAATDVVDLDVDPGAELLLYFGDRVDDLGAVGALGHDKQLELGSVGIDRDLARARVGLANLLTGGQRGDEEEG